MTRVGMDDGPVAIDRIRSWPRRMSYSQLAALHGHYEYACPRRAAYHYITRLPQQRNWPLVLGSAVDAAVSHYFNLRIVGAEDPAGQAHQALDREIQDEVRDHPELLEQSLTPLESYGALGHRSVNLVVEKMGDLEVASVQEHHTFSLSVQDDLSTEIVGWSDLVDVDGKLWDLKFSGSPRWSLIDDPDWKAPEHWEPEYELNPQTGRRRRVPGQKQPRAPQIELWHEGWLADKKDQLLTYWLARNAEQKRRGEPIDPPLTGEAGLIVIYGSLKLKEPQLHTVDVRISLDDAEELLHRYGEAVRTVQRGAFPLRPGRHCGWCDYQEICRRDQDERGTEFMKAIDIPF